MVDRAALEMPCPARDLGFESLTLRQKTTEVFGLCCFLCLRLFMIDRTLIFQRRKVFDILLVTLIQTANLVDQLIFFSSKILL